jgi:stearoyl-CoA desaturase (delta-9 desaturase)
MIFFLEFILVVFVTTQIANVCTTVYLHRGLSHRSMKFKQPLESILRFVLWLTTTVVRQEWVAVHRKHHAHTDTDQDPHSPLVKGFWNIQLWNYFYYRREAKNPEIVKTYSVDLPYDWFDRMGRMWWVPVLLLTSIFIAILGPIWGPIGVLAHFLFYVVLSSTINGAGHWFGYRHHENSATNLWTVAMITAGEGFHNNHHDKPASAKLGNKWWELDVGWMAITLFALIHQVKLR